MVMRAVLKEPKKIVPLCFAALFFLTMYINSFPCTVKVAVYPLYREFMKESLVHKDTRFIMEEGNGVNIYYKDSSSYCVGMVKDTAETSLKMLLRDFGYRPESKIDIIIYPEYSEMADKIGLGDGSKAMGVYYGGTISILEPGKWIEDKADMEDIFIKQGPILHELTHYMLDYMSGGNMPVWFTEGVALYEEYRVNGVKWAPYNYYTGYYSVNELDNKFDELDETKAYKQSFLIMKYVGENFGIESIKNMLSELRMGKSVCQVIKSTLKIEMDELFKRSLQGQD
jgi:hypothetical protein